MGIDFASGVSQVWLKLVQPHARFGASRGCGELVGGRRRTPSAPSVPPPTRLRHSQFRDRTIDAECDVSSTNSEEVMNFELWFAEESVAGLINRKWQCKRKAN